MVPTTAITAISTAYHLAKEHLDAAGGKERNNAAACVQYLLAAQALLHGLEREVDEILAAAKRVAGDQPEGRGALMERMDLYLNRDELRTLLGRTIKGLDAGHDQLSQDAHRFLLGSQAKVDAAERVLSLLAELSGYLSSLSTATTYDLHDYSGPSGIDCHVLMELYDALERWDGENATDARAIIELAKNGQERRTRVGLRLVDDAARVAKVLSAAFGLVPG